MKNILSLVAAVCCAGALSAQITVLTEDFNANIVPPAGWTTQNLNSSTTFSEPWSSDGAGQAWHGDGGSADGQAENILATPMMDFTGMSNVYFHMDITTNWVAYMAHSIAEGYGYGNGATTLEISHDGGVTWVVEWTDNILVAEQGLMLDREIDLSAHAGHTGVMLAIHFSGDWAHEVWIDSITIDDQSGGGPPPGLTYSISGLVAGGVATFAVANAVPGSNVIIGYSLSGAGPISTGYGIVDMTPPISTFPTLVADASGDAVFSPTVPLSAAGRTLYTQGLNVGVLTNSLAELVL